MIANSNCWRGKKKKNPNLGLCARAAYGNINSENIILPHSPRGDCSHTVCAACLLAIHSQSQSCPSLSMPLRSQCYRFNCLFVELWGSDLCRDYCTFSLVCCSLGGVLCPRKWSGPLWGRHCLCSTCSIPFFALDGIGNIILAYLVSKSLLILFAISKNKFYFNYILLKKSFQVERCSYIVWSWSTRIYRRYRKPCFLCVVQLLSIWYYALKLNIYLLKLPFY